MQTRIIHYNDGETLCSGFIAYEEQAQSPKPCVLVAHDWGGRTEETCNKAKKLAAMGFVGFAIDMYGEGKIGTTKIEKRALMTPLRQNRQRLANRIIAAFNAAVSLPQVDKTKIAAIGYCFGGLCVLDLARTGVDIKGVVSFHGLLSAPEYCSLTPIPAKILILHGYDDPLVPLEEVHHFANEMTKRQVDWQVHMYGLTAHSFTDPEANDDEMGLHYNKEADHRSWISMELFLREILEA
ncbi:dienelactone hydrolase family protein [Legionella fairfieldensis]|uniref:dienelactone hydrolase family protein n=1 Tax=Legionella fairfieldensis TaxID=45064 RepID=UPI00048DA5F2|nr:dienelactone hydrolase family protein [Legionella fairfieldensis]